LCTDPPGVSPCTESFAPEGRKGGPHGGPDTTKEVFPVSGTMMISRGKIAGIWYLETSGYGAQWDRRYLVV
jgi:hypothetical protein